MSRTTRAELTAIGRLLVDNGYGGEDPLFRNGSEVARAVAKWGGPEGNPYFQKEKIAAAAINAAFRGDRMLPAGLQSVLRDVISARVSRMHERVQASVMSDFDRLKGVEGLKHHSRKVPFSAFVDDPSFTELIVTSPVILFNKFLDFNQFTEVILSFLRDSVLGDGRKVRVLAPSLEKATECWICLFMQEVVPWPASIAQREEDRTPEEVSEQFVSWSNEGQLKIIVVPPQITLFPLIASVSPVLKESKLHALSHDSFGQEQIGNLPFDVFVEWQSAIAPFFSEGADTGDNIVPWTSQEASRWIKFSKSITVGDGDRLRSLNPDFRL
jgi:hypothetical protein